MARSRRKSAPVQLWSFVRLLWRYPWLGLGLLALLGSWYGYEVVVARPAMAWMGLPQATAMQPAYWSHVLRNDGFMVGYSELRGNPLWVIYHLMPPAPDAPHFRRPEHFAPDWRSLAHISQDDYNRSGFDRGHMAPNYAISRLYGRSGQLDTFLMTNITPQRPNLNRKVWQRLEEVESDEFVPRFKSLWVITGPIFDNHIERLSSSLQVEIPDACFKIYAVPAGAGRAEPLLLAFIVPQQVRGDERLDSFVTSVDRVEELSGFDFFSELPDGMENRLEAQVETAPWHLAEVAARPGRY
jgi:endonuclease G